MKNGRRLMALLLSAFLITGSIEGPVFAAETNEAADIVDEEIILDTMEETDQEPETDSGIETGVEVETETEKELETDLEEDLDFDGAGNAGSDDTVQNVENDEGSPVETVTDEEAYAEEDVIEVPEEETTSAEAAEAVAQSGTWGAD